jgi:hypothetical protein
LLRETALPRALPASPAFAPALLAVALVGCASVATRITVLDPAQKFAPTEHVLIMFDYPLN